MFPVEEGGRERLKNHFAVQTQDFSIISQDYGKQKFTCFKHISRVPQKSELCEINWLYGRYNKKHLDARIGAILITIHPDIIKCRACLISSIIRPGHTRVHFVAVIKTVQLRGGLALSQEGAWGALSWRRGHLWLNSLCVWLYSQGKVEQEGGIGTCGQRIVYHCGESYRWYGRGVHVIEFVARVGVNRHVQGEPVVFNI